MRGAYRSCPGAFTRRSFRSTRPAGRGQWRPDLVPGGHRLFGGAAAAGVRGRAHRRRRVGLGAVGSAAGPPLHVGSVQTVRGCPKHCSLCSVWRTDGQEPRQRGVDRVVRETSSCGVTASASSRWPTTTSTRPIRVQSSAKDGVDPRGECRRGTGGETHGSAPVTPRDGARHVADVVGHCDHRNGAVALVH
jgi:hypothetical protein